MTRPESIRNENALVVAASDGLQTQWLLDDTAPQHEALALLDRLLRPRHIAVLGAGWALNVIEQCRKMGFDGPVWPVHPTRDEIGGARCYRSLADLPGPPDATFIGVNRHATLDVVAASKFSAAFTFQYSIRPGTPAANLPDDTPHAVKLQRLQHLQATIEANVRRIAASREGTVQRILVEGNSRKSAAELMGRTECNRIVNFDGGPHAARLVGQMIDVRITQALPHSLRGEVLVREAV